MFSKCRFTKSVLPVHFEAIGKEPDVTLEASSTLLTHFTDACMCACISLTVADMEHDIRLSANLYGLTSSPLDLVPKTKQQTLFQVYEPYTPNNEFTHVIFL